MKVSAGAGPVITTQLYFKGDPWIRHDPGVRPSLILNASKQTDGLHAQFDFVVKAT